MSNILSNVIADFRSKDGKGKAPARAWDVLILMVALPLLCYTGYASWSFLSQNTRDTTGLIAVVGLFALDAGFILWSLVTAHHMATLWQGLVCVPLAILAFLGIVITVVLEYAGTYIPDAAKPLAALCVFGITLAQVAGGVLYYIVSPHTLESIQNRNKRTKLEMQRIEAEHIIEAERQEVELMQQIVKQRESLIALKDKAADQLIALGHADSAIDAKVEGRHTRSTAPIELPKTPAPSANGNQNGNSNGNGTSPKA